MEAQGPITTWSKVRALVTAPPRPGAAAQLLVHKTYLSYTNGVFEERDGRRIAYVPVYGMDTLDRAAREVYEASRA